MVFDRQWLPRPANPSRIEAAFRRASEQTGAFLRTIVPYDGVRTGRLPRPPRYYHDEPFSGPMVPRFPDEV